MKRHLASLAAAISMLALTSVSVISFHQEAAAQGYDIDCKVILCLAGGFPQGCANAKDYMIDRITSVPPKPPFGFCAFSNGTGYDDYEAPFSFLGGRDSFLCPEGSNLFYQPGFGGEGGQERRIFCYEEEIQSSFSAGGRFQNDFDSSLDRFRFKGITPPVNVNYRIQITIQPGQADEFRSPVFYGNTSTRFITQRPS